MHRLLVIACTRHICDTVPLPCLAPPATGHRVNSAIDRFSYSATVQ